MMPNSACGDDDPWAELFVGPFFRSWTGELPSFLVLAFEESQTYRLPSEDSPEEYGWNCNASNLLEAFKRDRFGWSLFAGIYEISRERLIEEAAGWQGRSRNKGSDARNGDARSTISPRQLREFATFLRREAAKLLARNTTPEDNALIVERNRARYVDMREVMSSNCRRSNVRQQFKELLQLYNPDVVFEFPEGADLLALRLLVEASGKKAEVRANVRTVVEFENKRLPWRLELQRLHHTTVMRVVSKIRIHSEIYRSISGLGNIKESHIKENCRHLLRLADDAKTAKEKGDCFERAVALLFDYPPMLEVHSRNERNGDEEIDLVIKNSVPFPFWRSLKSRFIFVECKNWAKRVGSDEVRNFECKLRNHGADTRIGFMVSRSGFTREAAAALKRSSRERYKVILLSHRAISEFTRSPSALLPWLEQQIGSLS